MADKKISKLYADNYVKPIEDGILVPVSVKEGAKWVSGAISTTDMKEYMSRKLADVFEKKGEGVSIATIHPGTGITVAEHEDGGVVLNVKTHNLYEVVTELPETGESDKIYVVTSSNGGAEGNIKTEYAFIDGAWEKLGEFVAPTVDADDVVTPEQMAQAINNAVKDLTNYDDKAIKDRLDILEEIDHDTFALKSEIPSLDGYAKTVDLAPYAKTVDLAPYAKTADIVIPTKVSDLTNDEGFLTSDDLPSLDNYVTKVEGKGLSTEDFTTALKTKLTGLENYDDTALKGRLTTLEAIDHSNYLTAHQDITGKVDKVEGKELSSNDFTDEFKTKLQGIEEGAEKNLVTSVMGKTGDVDGLALATAIPTKVSQLTNDEGFLTEDDLPSLDGYALKTSLEAAEALITALTSRVKDLEDKLAHYDARFGYNASVNGDEGWTKSFLLLEDNTPAEA